MKTLSLYNFVVINFFQFTLQKKIEKRNRKLIDYDGQRHSFQNLQANASKRKDDVKVNIFLGYCCFRNSQSIK